MRNLTIILTIITCSFLNPKLFAQPYVEWVKNYGGSDHDEANVILETSDQGFIVAGYSKSNNGDVGGNNGDRDCWILKLTESGELEWEKNFGGMFEETAYSILETSDQGFIFAGNSASNDGDVANNYGANDYWIVKLTEAGNMEWEKNYGGSGKDYAFSIQETSDGGFIVAGVSESNDGDVGGNNGEEDIWILKLTQTGDIDWEKNYGGSGQDKPRSILETTDGGFIFVGYSGSNDGDVGSNYGARDYWVVKLKMSGEIDWEKNYGGALDDLGYSIQEFQNQGYIIVGFSTSNDGDVENNHGISDSWILKLTESGEVDWKKTFGGSEKDGTYSIQSTSDGGFIVAGASESNDGDLYGNNGGDDLWVMKLQAFPTSAEEAKINSQITISPNPSNGKFNIFIESNSSINYVEIIDVFGRSIYYNDKIIPSLTINNFPKGIYWVHFSSENTNVIKKIIVN